MQTTCFYHPQNTLCNFCVSSECSLPLCPKCINIHLSQSNQIHHIQSLQETRQMIQQQLITSIQGLQHQLQSLQNGQYHPEHCLNQYTTVIEKYREQALKNINQHYDYIKRQLYEELKSKYSCHLSNLVHPLEERKVQLLKQKQKLSEKPLQCLINVISQQTILHVEKFLEHIGEKKNNFKMQLPRLEGIEGNMIKIIPAFNPKQTVKFTNRNSPIQTPSIGLSRAEVYDDYYDYDHDRINQLQNKLQQFRYNNLI